MNLPTVYVYSAQSATTNVTPDDIFTGTEEATETTPVQPIVTQLTTYNAALRHTLSTLKSRYPQR